MEGFSSVSNSTNKEQSSFWQFSDQLRLETTSLSNLSIGDSIWSDSFVKKPEDRRNYETPISAAAAAAAPADVAGWKTGFGMQQKLAFGNTNTGLLDRFNSNSNNNNNNNNNNSAASSKNSYKNGPNGVGIKDGNHYSGYSSSRGLNTNYNSGEIKNYFSKAVDKPANSGHGGKKNSNSNNDGKKKNGNRINGNNNNSNSSNAATDKWFKTLPPAEALPRNEAVGGYIFVCNNETMEENLKRQLFGLPSRYRDSVRAITPGLPLFLYNYSTHQLHGIYEAASFGGTNIDPMAWEDKKCPGESRFPAQVKVVTRKICGPLEEDAFRPILHHYDGPKFRLELSVPEALELLDIFVEKNA